MEFSMFTVSNEIWSIGILHVKKVLHISKYYYPFTGGIEQVARDAVRAKKRPKDYDFGFTPTIQLREGLRKSVELYAGYYKKQFFF